MMLNPSVRVELEHRFELLGELGAGSFATVYEARDRQLGDIVALKVPADAGQDEFLLQQAEFQFLADTVHSNLVGYHELIWAHDRPVLVLERLRGRVWGEALSSASREPSGIIEVVRTMLPGIIRGLAALHGRGLAHRDVKPDNLFVTELERPVWLDFGLAAAFGSGAGMFAGTPAFMAPEQLMGRPAEAASDWYALGALLYEALVGRLPWGGGPSRPRTPPDPRDTGIELPTDLAELVVRLLAYDATDRPSSRELADEYGGIGDPLRVSDLQRPTDSLGMLRVRDAFEAAGRGERRALVLQGGEDATNLADWFVTREAAECAVRRVRCHPRDSVPFSGVRRLCLSSSGDAPTSRDALERALLEVAQAPELLVVQIADAHWLDDDSARLLRSIEPPGPGLLLLLSAQRVSPSIEEIGRRWADRLESVAVEPAEGSTDAAPLSLVERSLCGAVGVAAEPLTTSQLLATVGSTEQTKAGASLRRIARAGWIVPLDGPGVAQATMWSPRRFLEVDPEEERSIHESLFEVLRGVENPSPHSMMVHAYGADDPEALDWALAAGRQAEAHGAFSRAAFAWRLAASLDEARREQLLLDAARAFEQAGKLTAAAESLADKKSLDPAQQVRAARLWMYGGGFSEGESMFRTALDEAGAWLPKSDRLGLLLGMLARIPALLFGPPSERLAANDEEHVELDAMWAAMSALSVSRPPASTFLSASYIRVAKRKRSRRHLFRGLCYEAVFLSSIGGGLFRRRAQRVLDACSRFVATNDAWEDAFMSQTKGVTSWMKGDWEASATHCARAGARMADYGDAGAWESISTIVYHLSARCWAGDFAGLERSRQEAESAALGRGDRWATATLRVGDLAVGLLAADLPDVAAERADSTRQWWPSGEFSLIAYQHLMLLVRVDLYRGDAESALRRLDDAWAPMRRTGILSLEMPRVLLLALRGLALLQVDGQPKGLSSVVRGLSASKLDVARALADMLKLGRDGAKDQAWSALAERFDGLGMALHSAGCRVRAGEPMPMLPSVQNPAAMVRIAVPQRLK